MLPGASGWQMLGPLANKGKGSFTSDLKDAGSMILGTPLTTSMPHSPAKKYLPHRNVMSNKYVHKQGGGKVGL